MTSHSLCTTRLVLRPLQESDESDYCALFTDASLMEHVGGALTSARAAQAFRASLSMMGAPAPRAWLWRVALPVSHRDVGLVGLVEREGLPEIGAIIVEAQQGKGYAFEALERVRDEGFTSCGLTIQSGRQMPSNFRSVGLMLKLGFRQVQGQRDRIEWRLDREDWLKARFPARDNICALR